MITEMIKDFINNNSIKEIAVILLQIAGTIVVGWFLLCGIIIVFG